MNPAQMLTKVEAAIDLLVAAGEPHGGLFPSLLDLGGESLPRCRRPSPASAWGTGRSLAAT